MSLKPGIGATWFEKYHTDVFPHDHVVVRGKECRPPRFYDQMLFKFNTDPSHYLYGDGKINIDIVKHDRFIKSQSLVDDNTEDRLLVKEQVKLAQISRLHRNLS